MHHRPSRNGSSENRDRNPATELEGAGTEEADRPKWTSRAGVRAARRPDGADLVVCDPSYLVNGSTSGPPRPVLFLVRRLSYQPIAVPDDPVGGAAASSRPVRFRGAVSCIDVRTVALSAVMDYPLGG